MAKDMAKPPRAPESRPVQRNPPAKLSERLKGDAQEMEARLLQLRSNMLEEKQKLEAERPAKYGGSRWRSASEGRGSIRKYAEEVQKPSSKRTAKRSDSGGASGSKGKDKRGGGAARSPGVLSVATVKGWTPAQVQQWLRTLGLDEFEGAFEFHQVDGKRLLSLASADCAAFGVPKLSSRNRLLAEVESLRDRASGGPPDATHAEIVDPTLRDSPPAPRSEQPSGLKHWSQVTPLSEAKVHADTDDGPANLADGQFNEDDSHASFMKALLEWRASDNDGAAAVDENQGGDWVNPMLDTPSAEMEPAGGALLKGSYDEVLAHESFAQALQAWRRGGTEDARRPPTGECADSSCTTSDRKSCWQCYRVGSVDGFIADEQSKKYFCSAECRNAFQTEHARLYSK